MAFKRLLVVVVCHPPSHSWIQPSPILAIKLPCRRTSATSPSKVTEVLPLLQLVPWAMAAFIWDSILRIWRCVPLTLLIYTESPCCGEKVASHSTVHPSTYKLLPKVVRIFHVDFYILITLQIKKLIIIDVPCIKIIVNIELQSYTNSLLLCGLMCRNRHGRGGENWFNYTDSGGISQAKVFMKKYQKSG